MPNKVYIYVNGQLALTVDKVALWRTMQTQEANGDIELRFHTEDSIAKD